MVTQKGFSLHIMMAGPCLDMKGNAKTVYLFCDKEKEGIKDIIIT